MKTQPGFQVEGVGRMGELCFAFYKESRQKTPFTLCVFLIPLDASFSRWMNKHHKETRKVERNHFLSRRKRLRTPVALMELQTAGDAVSGQPKLHTHHVRHHWHTENHENLRGLDNLFMMDYNFDDGSI